MLRASPNQVLTHAARAAAKQLWWPRAARAKGSGHARGPCAHGNFAAAGHTASGNKV